MARDPSRESIRMCLQERRGGLLHLQASACTRHGGCGVYDVTPGPETGVTISQTAGEKRQGRCQAVNSEAAENSRSLLAAD